jgi:hypothetical protein
MRNEEPKVFEPLAIKCGMWNVEWGVREGETRVFEPLSIK